MKSTPESVGYELWPSCDVILKCWAITSVHTGVCVDLPLGYVGIIYNKNGSHPGWNYHSIQHFGYKFPWYPEIIDAQYYWNGLQGA